MQGGSSAEGYPYGYVASPAGMLRQRLQHTFPEKRIEFVTTAMSAGRDTDLDGGARRLWCDESNFTVAALTF